MFGVVGEMDHGKTTLLDTFLHTSYQKQEFGGTTQVIRASDMHIPYKTLSGETIYHPCTFLDTPGQSCFSFVNMLISVHSRFERMEAFSLICLFTLFLCTKDLRMKHGSSFNK